MWAEVVMRNMFNGRGRNVLARALLLIAAPALSGVLCGLATQAVGAAREIGGPCTAGFSCARCVPDSCQPLESDQFLIGPTYQLYVERCVEYDGQPPAHCATVWRWQYDIGEWSSPFVY